MDKLTNINKVSIPKEITFAFLALISVGLLIFELSHKLAAEDIALFRLLDFIIALIFLSDFAVGMVKADNKKIFFRERWYELIASIPLSGTIAQALRPIRLIRVLRIIRLAVRLKIVANSANAVTSFRLVNLAIIVLTVVFAGSVIFFDLEQAANPEVNNIFDAFWWAMVTSTTVGYGDISPVTTGGRIVAMVLMLTGIGTVGAVIATVTGKLTDSEN